MHAIRLGKFVRRASTGSVLAVAMALAGCNAVESFFPGSNTAKVTADSQDPNKIIRLPMAPGDLDCPAVDVFEGGSSSRMGGVEGSTVRYQFDISDLSRECNPRGKDFALRVGVSGRLLIGPAGSPGVYSSSLHVLVKRIVDNKPMFEKTYSVSANTAGGAQSAFQVVTDPIILPLTRPELADDYSIFVGFVGGGAPVEHRRRRQAH